MRKETAAKHFGSAAALARALGISPQAVSDWPELIPIESAVKLEALTEGALAVEEDAYLIAAVQAARERLSAARAKVGT